MNNDKMKDESNLLAKVVNCDELIEYQTGAVVSRTIIKKPVGTVTLFAFDKGEALSEHTAPYDALVIIYDGQAEIKISGKPYSLKNGEMIIMPANEPHSVYATAKFKMLLIMIKA